MARFHREYAVFIEGRCVCVGDTDYMAEVFFVTPETARGYAVGRAPAWMRVKRLEPVYRVKGMGVLPAREATAALGCSMSSLVRRAQNPTKRVMRVVRRHWSLPQSEIEALCESSIRTVNEKR